MFTGFRFETTLRLAGGGSLRLAFGADAWRTRGFELDIGETEVVLSRLTPTGPKRMATVRRPAATEGGVALRVRFQGRLEVRIDGKKIAPRRGWSGVAGGAGRLVLGAAGGVVRLEGCRLEATLGAASRRRIQRIAAQGAPSLPPPPRSLPLLGPLARIDRGRLVAGLPDQDAAALWRLRGLAIAGRTGEALREASVLADRHPKAPGPPWLLGAVRMLGLADASGALAPLALADDLCGAAGLRGDANWMLGRLTAADSAYAADDDLGGRALVAWARGDRGPALELVREAEMRGCSRRGQRIRLVEDLALLHAWKPLARATIGPVTGLSDLDAPRARRVVSLARPFLHSADGWLPGKVSEQPLTVLLCADPRTFALWNERLGGARFEEADGIYRPGAGLIVLLDDDDDDVMRRRLQHELVHHLIYQRAWVLPRPFEEGLCEYLSGARPLGRTLTGLGSLVPGRFDLVSRMAEARHLEDPVEVLLRRDLRDGDRGREDYAQAWAAVHLMSISGHLKTALAGLPALEKFLRATLTRAALRAHVLGLKGQRQ